MKVLKEENTSLNNVVASHVNTKKHEQLTFQQKAEKNAIIPDVLATIEGEVTVL